MRGKLRVTGVLVITAITVSGLFVYAQNREKKPADSKSQVIAESPDEKKAATDDADEQAIRASADAFVKAYNAHDAKGLAALFALKAEFIEEDGTLTKGREAIEKSFAEFFAEHPRAVIEVEPDSIRVLTPNIAVEEGAVRGIPDPDGPENISTYVAVHVKVDAQWLVASVRDFEATAEELMPGDHLQPLAWLVGEWIDESPEASVHSTYQWVDNGNFILQEFSAHIGGQIAMTGSVRIGWDPLTQQFKSWVFDSEGGYAEGLWIQDGDEWMVKSQGVTGAGETASSTNVYRPIDEDTIGWRSFNRIVDGALTEDIDEVVVKRKPPPPAE